MTDLDTSAYTPAHEAEEAEENTDNETEEETQRSRYQIPLDNAQEENLLKTIDKLEEKIRDDTDFQEKIDELRELLNNYSSKKFLKMNLYECDKCGEIFDTKQGIGVHQKMNPNCNGEDRPWQNEEPSYTKIRVDNR